MVVSGENAIIVVEGRGKLLFTFYKLGTSMDVSSPLPI
jgi:hypothetical protein